MRRAAWLLAGTLAWTAVIAAQSPSPEPLSLAGTWKFRIGDNMAWAAAGLDDSAWIDVEVPSGWGPFGYHGPASNLAWYRKTIDVAALDPSRLSLAMGPVDSAYEIYLGGRFAGRVGALPPRPREDYDRRAVYSVPADVIDRGRVVVALRVWTPGTASNAGGVIDGPILVGHTDRLAQLEAQRAYFPLFMIAVFSVIGLSQITLAWRGREHFWFGTACLTIGLYTLLQSPLKYELPLSFHAAKEIEHALLYLWGMIAFEFYLPLLGLPFNLWHRAFQALMGALGAFVVLTPGLYWNAFFLLPTEVALVLMAVYVVAIVIRAAVAGNPDARHVMAGIVLVAAAAAYDLLIDYVGMPGPHLLQGGFVALVLAMTFALAERFKRTHHELIELRQALEARVAERTAALEERSRQLAEANQSKTNFLATISHEIRTPLNGIMGITRMLLQSPLQPRQRELGEIVQAQGRSLLTIISDILDYSKMEAGRVGLDLEDFDLGQVVEEITRVHREQAGAKGLGFSIVMDPGLPHRYRGDRVRLRQVLDNLLSNAIKFTDAGEVGLRLGRGPREEIVRIEVADTGIGLDLGQARHLFQPFTQADTTTTRRYGGTGLGLAIAKSLVELMGGEIGCTSQPGKGARFWFTLRMMALHDTHAQTPLKTPLPVPARRADGVRVLLAEDHEVNRLVTVSMLEELGCMVDVVGNGREAADAALATRYDLILMDCQMPVMDGYAATEEIRRREDTPTRTPIVAVTAYSLREERFKCLASGMDDILTKPLSIEQLLAAMSRWVTTLPPVAAAAPAPPLAPPVNPGMLADLERRSPQLLQAVLQHYVRHSPKEIEALRAAVSRGERGAIRGHAHDLAGSSSMIGAQELAKVLRESEADDGSLDLPAWLARVESAHAVAHAILSEKCGSTA